MHGDFSRWFPRVPINQVGILAQEGRLLIDADVNAHSLLGMRWQDLAARAAFGAGIAAIPAEALTSWQVVGAQVASGQVTLTIDPGLAWADGVLVELPAAKGAAAGTPVTLTATPIGLPIQAVPTDLGAAGTRDAVVLEVWRQALSGFQAPAELIEPALGGPDTAERIETCFALRLYRLAAGDDCRTIVGALKDNLAARGHLNVTLAPTTTTTGDCPVVTAGGYSGFEHDLYRVEIADVASGAPMFKWSQWNGGLVGRGAYSAATKKVTITGNDQAIQYSGLTAFYFEALVFDTSVGHWRVAYGARASFDTAGLIDLSGPATYGTIPSGTSLCFRIWNDLRAVSEFPAGPANELRDGIRLEFDAGATYVPGDYWTFSVRAGLANPGTLVDHAPPFGVHHHRVVLAELDWGTGPLTTTTGIEDCRIPLHPVTATDGCCTHSVGDGVTSHGDFTSINAAIAALPSTGGRVCVLPGEYHESVGIEGLQHIELVGCGPRSQIIAPVQKDPKQTAADPAIHVLDSSSVWIRSLQVVAGQGGIAILCEADASAGQTVDGTAYPNLEDIHVVDCLVLGGGSSCIEVRGYGENIEIRDNHVQIQDQVNEWAGITVEAVNARIERNQIEVVGATNQQFTALGGIWLRSGCDEIDVLDNVIDGGSAHGVMLGNLVSTTTQGRLGYVYNQLLPGNCVGCGHGIVVFPPETTWTAGDPLYLIRIERNQITRMGMAGIGVFGFSPSADAGVITVSYLTIANNEIHGNLQRDLADLPTDLTGLAGYGAISLADAQDVTIRDNLIFRNALQNTALTCGVFIASAGALDLSGNRIFENGTSPTSTVSATAPHGGVWISLAYELNVDQPGEVSATPRIAIAMRGNEVHAPNGPALVLNTIGNAQIVGNALTSSCWQGAVNYTSCVSITSVDTPSDPVAMASTFSVLKLAQAKPAAAKPQLVLAGKAIDTSAITAENIAGVKVTLGAAATTTVVSTPPESYTPVGSIQFNDNHCGLNIGDQQSDWTVQIASLVDVEVVGNHFLTQAELVFTGLQVAAGNAIVTANRFDDQAFMLFSAYVTGTNVIATSNLADHCIAVPAAAVFAQNIEVDMTYCPLTRFISDAVSVTNGGGS